MGSQPRMKSHQPYIVVPDVPTVVNFIQTRRPSVGMQHVWVNVLLPAQIHVLPRAMADVLIMLLRTMGIINQELVEDVLPHVQQTVLVVAPVYVKELVHRHVSQHVKLHVLITVNGHVLPTVEMDVCKDVRMDVKGVRHVVVLVLVTLLERQDVRKPDVRQAVSTDVIKTVLELLAVPFVEQSLLGHVKQIVD